MKNGRKKDFLVEAFFELMKRLSLAFPNIISQETVHMHAKRSRAFPLDQSLREAAHKSV